MKAGTNSTLALLAFFILVWVCKNLSVTKKPDEIVIDGIHTPRKPCISVMNELYGAGIDSSKVCDCLIPKFYELVKDDSLQLAKFKEVGLHGLEGEKHQKAIPLFENSLRENLLDSSYKLHLTGLYLTGFKRKLRQELDSLDIPNHYNKDSLADCIIDKMNNNITLAEYLTPDYSEVERIMTLFTQCISQSKQ